MKKAIKKGSTPILLLVFIIFLIIGIGFVLWPRVHKSNSASYTREEDLNVTTIDIIAERYMFAPTLIRLKKGERIKLTLNTVDVQHGIFVPELNISLNAYPGRPAKTIITPDKIGEYTTNCSLYCGKDHNKMKITFMVYE